MELNNKLKNKEEKGDETINELTEKEFSEINKDISQALIDMKKEKDNSEENIDSEEKDITIYNNIELNFENNCNKNINNDKNLNQINDKLNNILNNLDNQDYENNYNNLNSNKIYFSTNNQINNLNKINNILLNIDDKLGNESNVKINENRQININNINIESFNNDLNNLDFNNLYPNKNINLYNLNCLNRNLFTFNNNIPNNFNDNLNNNNININNILNNMNNDRNNNFLGNNNNNNINFNKNYNYFNNLNINNNNINFKNLFSPSCSFSAGKHLESAEFSKNIINLETILKGKDKRTTLIIRNIPMRYSISLLIKELNNKFFHKFDVVYLPQDYTNNFNLGFGFINFIEPIHLVSFYEKYEGKKWNCFHSNKKCQLAYSKYQGRKELIKYIYKKLGISDHSNNKENIKKSFYITDNEKFEKPPIEIPMKFYNSFKNYYPYSLCHNKNNNIFIVDNFYNF